MPADANKHTHTLSHTVGTAGLRGSECFTQHVHKLMPCINIKAGYYRADNFGTM